MAQFKICTDLPNFLEVHPVLINDSNFKHTLIVINFVITIRALADSDEV